MIAKCKSFLMVLCATFLATFFVGSAVYAATTISTDISTGGSLTVGGLSSLNGQASTTQLSASGRLYVGTSGLTTILGDAATSTFTGGVNLTTGCFAINGSCVASTATSSVSTVSAANGTVTVTPTTGNVTVALNLGNTNTWTAAQTFSNTVTVSNTLSAQGVDGPGTFYVGTTSASGIVIGRSAITTTMPGTLDVKNLTVTSTVASSTFANGINLTTGCFAISGVCMAGGGASVGTFNTFTALQIFNANASTTQLSASGKIYVGSTGTTTINGNLGVSSFSGGLTITPDYSLDTSSPGNLHIGTTTATGIIVGKSGVTTSIAGPVSMASTMSVGGGTAVNGIIFGSCSISNSTLISPSSAAYFNCTNALGANSSYRVFIQATSSLPSSLFVQSASSTGTNLINLQIYNASATSTAPGGISLNFFGIN